MVLIAVTRSPQQKTRDRLTSLLPRTGSWRHISTSPSIKKVILAKCDRKFRETVGRTAAKDLTAALIHDAS
jgi:hypothetical protein